ncbi:c-type cytochrome [Sphingomonas sp.]|uniref:c-type cytochrome n=1 Tax=Sphingomonas sp. TaxID=28214 RepID=UPI000DB58DF9|nr:c-type cytochrome [Sphingomonas sp.]PZU10990.1 MAG: cytochrome c family protein [Sphingomonas sp.]
MMAVIAGAAPQAALAQPDLANGKRVFTTCSYCHGANGEGAGVGPPLKGVVGRKAGAAPDFPYSEAMKTGGITWTPERLEAFLAHPMQDVKGTRMAFPGVSRPKDLADVIAYLKTLK